MYIIHSNDGYWSNEDGWVDFKDLATTFSNQEKEEFELPLGNNVQWFLISWNSK